MSSLRTFAAALALALGLSQAATAQQPDSLQLGALQRAAVAHDPRTAQLALQQRRAELRLGDIAAERLPSLGIEGQGQYQSDVTQVPLKVPGQTIPTPPHDTYDARLTAQEKLFDPTTGARRRVEEAQLAQSEAQVRTSLYGLRQQVNDAFFQALLLQQRAGELSSVITDLEAQLTQTRHRVDAGTALPGEAATLEAELLRRREDLDGLRADRAAALQVLSDLTGTSIDSTTALAVPSGSEPLPADPVRARPEFEQFARSRDLLSAQESVIRSQLLPRVSAYGRAGYGKPGLNMLNDKFDSYWLAGVQVQWSPWTWGTNARDREALALQRDVVTSEEAAFANGLARSVTRSRATIAYLESALTTDDRIVALREQVERETRARFDEGVVTAAEYVNRRTDVLDARLARITHRIELAQARTSYLTTLGIEQP